MDLSNGRVQQLIATLQQARPGTAARDRGYSAPGARHGSVARTYSSQRLLALRFLTPASVI